MDYRLLEGNTENFVTHIYESPDRIRYAYHNLAHTIKVVEHARQVAEFYVLPYEAGCALSLAAWFHDTGQLFGGMEGHEERSVVIMKDYFITNGVDIDFINGVADLIMITKTGAFPQTLAEKIICDADTWHFGTPFFHETEFLVRTEMEMRTGMSFPGWHHGSLQLLKSHIFYTEYCQLLLGAGKLENIAWLEAMIASTQAY